MQLIVLSSLLFIISVHGYIGQWPSVDQIALRVQTALASDAPAKRDGFRVDFYIPNDAEETASGIMVTKWQLPDGKHITEMYDWVKDLRITRVIQLGEVAHGQPPFQQFCFASKLGSASLLSADSFLRLRQRNSLAVRVAEEDGETESVTFVAFIPLSHISRSWSSVTTKTCGRVEGVFVTEEIYKNLAGSNETTASVPVPPLCTDSNTAGSSCQCVLKYCFPWYPCGWKYCEGNSTQQQSTTSHSKLPCGVRTCRAIRLLRFPSTVSALNSPMCDTDWTTDVC